jgi:hypothetical protein
VIAATLFTDPVCPASARACRGLVATRLRRTPPPDGPGPLLERFPDGLTTQEVAALLARGNDAPDRDAAERELPEAGAVRTPAGDDAVWTASA